MRPIRLSPPISAFCLFILATAVSAKADVLTFNVPYSGIGPYTEKGITIINAHPGSELHRISVGNGALSLVDNQPENYIFTYSGGAFDVLGARILFAGGPPGALFHFYGYQGDTLTGVLNLTNVPPDCPCFPRLGDVQSFVPPTDIVLGAGFQNITSFRFTLMGGFGGVGITNVSFQPAAPQGPGTGPAVPEPGTVVLLGTGLAGLGAAVRKRYMRGKGLCQ